MPSTSESLFELVTEAVRDVSEHGFDSMERIDYWLGRLRLKARETLTPEHQMEALLKAELQAAYRRNVEGGAIMRMHPGVSRFTVEKLRPTLRAELDRRIMASAQLIKLNRAQAIEKTLQRFSGWATSVPAGGSDAVDKVEVKASVRKALTSLPFEERRVAIDQGHKLVSSISATVATRSGAIAYQWNSMWRQPNYNYRPDHKERDGLVYTIRGNWAIEKGLMRKGPAGYTEDITQPAEEPFCRCQARYLYNLRDLPEDMITPRGREALAAARRAVND